ncbi:SAP domain-containing ribonucleoprotein-like [Salvelinus namaycush]|uniref:SAP domain-containing ribonucleoprotein-like n=1 Tax=Salvelinus namaycush TaxID=8040 RepID=A0A8U1EVK1_SALNM|nr:SAP domain-containing ribonucleoprotein-like [Salvelinus namaycush]
MATLFEGLSKAAVFFFEDDMGLNEDDVLGEEPEDLTKEDAITEDNDKKPIVSEETAEKKVVKITPPASVDERVQKRAERFNVPASADDKKAIRAARSVSHKYSPHY